MIWLLLFSVCLALPRALLDASQLSLNRFSDKEKIHSLSGELSINPKEAVDLLLGNQLSPSQREVVVLWLRNQSEIENEIHRLLDAKGKKHSPSIGNRISALRILDSLSQPQSQPDLWIIFLRSRFASLPEDPDLFERAIFIITKLAKDHPERCGSFLKDEFPELLVDVITKYLLEIWWDNLSPKQRKKIDQWKKDNPNKRKNIEEKLRAVISKEWEENGYHWIESMQSAKGSTSNELAKMTISLLVEQLDEDFQIFVDDVRSVYGITDVFDLSPPRISTRAKSG